MFIRCGAIAITLLALFPISGYTADCSGSETWTGNGMDQEWNNASNWNPNTCIPGSSVTNTDTAIFSTAGAGSISLDSPGISPGLSALTFDNSNGFTINSTMGNYLQFNGATSQIQVDSGNQKISSSVKFNTTNLNIGIANSASLTLDGPSLSDIGFSSINFQGPGQLNYFADTSTTQLELEGNFTQNNGTFTQQNSLEINIASESGIFFFLNGDFVLNNGTTNLKNTGLITGMSGDNNMSGINFTASNLILNSGELNLDNEGDITVVQQSSAVNITAATSFSVNGGALKLTNSGQILGNNNTGPRVEMPSGTTGSFTLNEGSISLVNHGTIGPSSTVALGTSIQLQDMTNGKLILNNGSLSLQNSGAISTNGLGNFFQVANLFQMNNGSLLIDNSGPITNGSNGSFFEAGSFVMGGGTVTLSNSGSASGTETIASVLILTSGTINAGNIAIKPNEGSASGPNSFGSAIVSFGAFTMNGGTLMNSDAFLASTLSVEPSASVSGTGIFNDSSFGNAIAFNNSGTVTPGSAGIGASNPGTMTIGGTYTQGTNGTLVTNVFDAATYSNLQITGATVIDGTLDIGQSPGAIIYPTDVFTIVQSALTNGVTGQFSHMNNFAANYIPHITYFPDHIDLTFTASAPSFIGGYAETAISSVNIINVRLGREIFSLRDRIRTNQTSTSNQIETTLYASNDELISYRVAKKSPPTSEPSRPWNFYAGPIGNVGTISAQKSQLKTNFWSAGALAGFDYAWSQVGAGFEVEYDHIVGKAEHNAGRFLTNEAHGSLYATYVPKQVPALSLNGIIGGSYEWYEIKRYLSEQTAKGTPQGGEFDAFLGLEYDFNRGGSFGLTPLASVQYIYLAVNSYQETGTETLNFKVNSQTVQSLRSTLGSRFNYLWSRSDTAKKPLTINTEIDFSWQREYLNHSRSLQATPLAFVQPFSTLVVPGSGRNFFLAGIDFLATYDQKYGCEASYDFEWNSLYLDHNFYLGFHLKY